MMGIAQSVQPLLSLSHGEGAPEKVRAYRKYARISSAVAGILFLAVSIAFPEALIRVFSDQDAELVSLSAACLRLYAPAYFIMGIGIPIGVYFQALGRAVKAFVVTISRGIVFPVLFALLLPLVLGEKEALWLAVPLAELVTAIIALALLGADKKEIRKEETHI